MGALRHAFHAFDVERVAAMTDADAGRLVADASITRNLAKIAATVADARALRTSGSSTTT